MIKLRVSAGAYLYNDRKVLLMKRSPNKDIAPGLWAGIGGHLEHSELNDPTAACLREIDEETGIKPYEIQDLRLRYIIHSKRPEEIHLQYHFFGIYKGTKPLKRTDEGELHWIDEGDIVDLEMPPALHCLFKHYYEIGKYTRPFIYRC